MAGCLYREPTFDAISFFKNFTLQLWSHLTFVEMSHLRFVVRSYLIIIKVLQMLENCTILLVDARMILCVLPVYHRHRP